MRYLNYKKSKLTRKTTNGKQMKISNQMKTKVKG